jgi:glycosyltransferase involved in cell wall biosynthesis
MRGKVTLDALRSCCERVDAVSFATPREVELAEPGTRLVPRPPAGSRWTYLRALAQGGSYFVPDRAASLRDWMRAAVRSGDLDDGYDLVWAHFALMAGAGLEVGARARVLDVDASAGADARRAAVRDEGSPRQRAYHRLDAAAIAREERRRCDRYDHVVVAWEGERERLGPVRPPVSAIPNTAADGGGAVPPASERQGLLFVGTLDHQPNVEAVRFLVEDVLPRLAGADSGPTLTVAGRSPSSAVRALCRAPGVELVADAPTLEPLYRRARAAVAPLWLGGGTKIKLVEALARGTAVVATPVAVEGLAFEDGVNGLLAGDADTFAARCSALLEDAGLADRLGAAARRTWEEHYRPQVARDAIVALVERLTAAGEGRR